MLTKIRLKNFRSYKQETIIDFSSTNYKQLEDTNVINGITKGALFIGGNASGKTNAIYSLSFLLDLLFLNGARNNTRNFCIFSNDQTMDLEYTFVIENSTITYTLAFNRNGMITSERLCLNNETVLDRIGFGAESSITEKKYYDKNDIDGYTPFIRSIYFNTKFTSYPVLAKWFEFLSNSVYFNATKTQVINYNPNFEVQLLQYLDKNGEDEINKFFSYFNFGQKIEYRNHHILSEYVRMESDKKRVYVKRNNANFWIPMDFESLGNITLLNMLPSLLHCIKTDSMFIVDEFSSSFHNDLEELIVRYFMKESSHSQMFFVSHSTNLLSSTLLRPDQIYTVDFADSRGSVVKRVSSEHPRETQNFEKMYLGGVFNGLPHYKNN